MEKSYSQVPILDKRKIDVGKYFSLGLVLVSIILNFAKTMIKKMKTDGFIILLPI